MTLAAALVILLQTQQTAAAPSPYFASGAFQQIDRRGTAGPRIRTLCSSLSARGTTALMELQDRLVTQSARDTSIANVRELACARSLLAGANARSREGPGIMPGQPWATAAVSALSDWLRREPTNIVAAELLGAVVQDNLRSHYPAFGDPAGEPVGTQLASLPNAAALVHRAGVHAGASPGLLRSCTSLLLDIGDPEGAYDCSLRALSAGYDSTWHLLRLASIAFTRGDTISGVIAVEAAASASHDSATRAEFGWHLERGSANCKVCIDDGALNPSGNGYQQPLDLLSDQERAQWFAMPSSEVIPWVRDAMQARLPLQHRENGQLHRLAPQSLTDIWLSGSLFVRNFVEHFWYTSYAAGTFRACVRGLDTISCDAPSIPDGDHHLRLLASWMRLWKPATGAAVELVTYAVPLGGLEPTGGSHRGRIALELNMRRWTIGGESRDTTLDLDVDATRGQRGGVVLDFLELPGSKLQGWSVAAVAPDVLRRGMIYQALAQPFAIGSVALSDLLLGASEQNVAWNSGTQMVPLAPIMAFGHESKVQLYFQVKSDSSRADLTVAIRLRRVVGLQAVGSPLIGMTSALPVAAGVTEISRELDFSRIPRDDYELEVAVSRAGSVLSRRTVTLAVRD